MKPKTAVIISKIDLQEPLPSSYSSGYLSLSARVMVSIREYTVAYSLLWRVIHVIPGHVLEMSQSDISIADCSDQDQGDTDRQRHSDDSDHCPGEGLPVRVGTLRCGIAERRFP